MFHPQKIFASLTLPSQSSAESHLGPVMRRSDPQHPLLAVLMAYKPYDCEKQYAIPSDFLLLFCLKRYLANG